MNKSLKIISILSVLALSACGTSNKISSEKNSSVESSESSSPISSSLESSSLPTSSSIESSSTSAASSSSSQEAPDTFLPSIDTLEKFASQYDSFISKSTSKIVYARSSTADYDKQGTYTMVQDEDEALVTLLETNGSSSTEYAGLLNNVLYKVSLNGSSNKAKRYKVVDKTSSSDPSDYMTLAKAESELKSAKDNMTVKGIIANYDYNLKSIPTTKEKNFAQGYDAYKNDDGTYCVEVKVINEAYNVIVFNLEMNFDKNGDISSLYTKRETYGGASWDNEKHAPIDGSKAISSVSITISSISYSNPSNSKLFDATPYYLTSCSTPEFGFTDDYGTYRETLKVGEELEVKRSVWFDNVKTTPETAADLDTLYITGIQDETVISKTTDNWGTYYTAVKEGKTIVYFGNSFVSRACSLEITVKNGSSSVNDASFSGEIYSDEIVGDIDYSEYDKESKTGIISCNFKVFPTTYSVISIGLQKRSTKLTASDFEVYYDEINAIGLSVSFVYCSGDFAQFMVRCSSTAEIGSTGAFGMSAKSDTETMIQFNCTVYSE